MNYQGPGRYRHYNGGEYEVIGLSIDVTNEAGFDGQICVVYRTTTDSLMAMVGRKGVVLEVEFAARSLDEFNQQVRDTGPECVGAVVPRFEKIS